MLRRPLNGLGEVDHVLCLAVPAAAPGSQITAVLPDAPKKMRKVRLHDCNDLALDVDAWQISRRISAIPQGRGGFLGSA